MPKIGTVRWRNVAEALSPLKTDRLVPRFVRLNPTEEVPLYAAWLEPADAGVHV